MTSRMDGQMSVGVREWKHIHEELREANQKVAELETKLIEHDGLSSKIDLLTKQVDRLNGRLYERTAEVGELTDQLEQANTHNAELTHKVNQYESYIQQRGDGNLTVRRSSTWQAAGTERERERERECEC
eukprot:GDKI01007181.1.p1 GENE.GDKI01007181.1~~GDKI01007181.1.p1  ORF type:complete len:130 (+),score=47.29 GDKI01007181.1:243-632(+)